jgi:elongation factor P
MPFAFQPAGQKRTWLVRLFASPTQPTIHLSAKAAKHLIKIIQYGDKIYLMAISATQIRKGMVIVFEGEPCKVVDFRHHTPGNLRAMVQTKLRSLRTGSSFEHRFRSADTVERAILEQHEMEYLYSDGEQHYFMNTENYEQTALNEDELGDAAQWLMPGLKIQIEFYEGAPIGIDLPDSLDLTVTATEPSLKGATVSNVNKPATLENGVTITVPPFINEGDKIRVNPSESRYIERVK